MNDKKRRAEEETERNKYQEQWEAANATIFEYGNLCMKMLVTLNSTAILASIAFIANFSSNENPVIEATYISKAMPHSFLAWSISLSLVLLATLFTYICHRWWPTLLHVWHKERFDDLYGKLTFKEKISSHSYNLFVYLGIFSGVLSLLMFLCGVWNITISFF